jgi:hypothetical protein
MKIELNWGRSSDIAEVRTESLAVLDQLLETGIPETLPGVTATVGSVGKPQTWTALKKTIPKFN